MPPSNPPVALAVDDHPVILAAMCSILSEAGFRCHKAFDGDEAITVLDAHANEITLLFSDVEMPGSTDGFALARYVAGQYPWIDIVIASGSRTPEEGDMPAKATFVPKPFSSEMVQDHLREILPDGNKPEPPNRVA